MRYVTRIASAWAKTSPFEPVSVTFGNISASGFAGGSLGPHPVGNVSSVKRKEGSPIDSRMPSNLWLAESDARRKAIPGRALAFAAIFIPGNRDALSTPSGHRRSHSRHRILICIQRQYLPAAGTGNSAPAAGEVSPGNDARAR